jgi:hypothetical protein
MDTEVRQRCAVSEEEEIDGKTEEAVEGEGRTMRNGENEVNADSPRQEVGSGIPASSGSSASVARRENVLSRGMVLPEEALEGRYRREIDVAVRAVQLSCYLTQQVQERILRKEEEAGSKTDRTLVTVAG